jgi:hypothetical protein
LEFGEHAACKFGMDDRKAPLETFATKEKNERLGSVKQK